MRLRRGSSQVLLGQGAISYSRFSCYNLYMPEQRDRFASALQLLVEHDFLVTVDSAADLTIRHPSWARPRYLEVKTRSAPPTPSSIRDDLKRWHHELGADQRALLYLVPRMTESLRTMAKSNVGIDVIAVD